MNLIPKRDEFGKWGFVSEDGTWMVTPIYNSVEPFDGDYAKVHISGHDIYINKDGKWFKEIPEDDSIEEYHIFEEPERRSPLDIFIEGCRNASAILHEGLKKTK